MPEPIVRTYGTPKKILDTKYGIMEGLIFPASLICHGKLTVNDKPKNYEDLFDDVLNASPLLRSNVMGIDYLPAHPVSYHRLNQYPDIVFFRPKEESNKEPDFETDGHVFDLDLKLLITKCLAEVASFVSTNQDLYLTDSGSFINNGDSTKMERSGAPLSTPFFYVQSICYGERFDQDSNDFKREREKDHIREILKTKKNLILVFPYWLTISTNEVVPLEDQAVEMVLALDCIFHRVFAYRHEAQPYLDTFFMFVMNNPESNNPMDYAICLTEVKNDHLNANCIELIEAPKAISNLLFDQYINNTRRESFDA